MLAKIQKETYSLTLTLGNKIINNTNELCWGINDCHVETIEYNMKFLDNRYTLNGISSINIYCDQQNKLRIGPFMGILISTDKKQRIFEGFTDKIYEKLASHMKDLSGVLLFFTVNEIDWNENSVQGHILDTSCFNYTPVCVPMPRIVYDRCLGNNSRLESILFREKALLRKQIKIFNNFVKLGKLETYDYFFHEPVLKEITLPYKQFSISELSNFLNKYGSVYVKPDLLYKGEGLIKVSKTQQGYFISHHRHSVFTSKNTTILEDIIPLMEDFGDISSSYVIQKSIDIARFFGNPFDVRIMLQKNCLGEWEITGQLARIGAEGCPITSPRSGGKVLNLEDTLLASFNGQSEKVDSIIKDINKYSITIGQLLEKKYGLLGELGIDLGMDKKGQIWLIEVNGKPLKVSMKRLKNKLVNYKIYSYPCQFGAFLDGFRKILTNDLDTYNEEMILELINIPSLPPHNIILHKELANLLNLNPIKPILLKIGSSEFTAYCHGLSTSLSPDMIGISENILTELGLPPGIRMKVLQSFANTLWLGPVMAIMKSPREYDLLKYGQEYKELKYIEHIAYDLGVFLFYFTAQDMKWNHKKMRGVCFNHLKKKWEEKSFPLPDIIFDLGTFINKESRDQAKNMINTFRKNDTTIVINNRRYFGKYEVYQAMNFLSETRQLAPPTSVLTQETLVNMLEVCPKVFVKSEHGSHGYDVTKIEKTGLAFNCEIGASKNRNKYCNNINELFELINNKYSERQTIIQKGVELLSHQGRVSDLRVIVQKDENSRWQVNMLSIRQAPSGCDITNISIGGKEIIPPLNELDKYFPHTDLSAISNFSTKCALAIECFFGPQGVLGLDIGLDTQNRLWLLEVNSKPCILDYLDLCQPAQAYRFYAAPLKYGLQQSKGLVIAIRQRLYNKLVTNRIV